MGYRPKKEKELLTPGTRQNIEERKHLKNKLLNTKSPRLQQQIQKAYRSKDKEVKRSARSDKRSYIEELADKAEQAAARGEMSVVYKITKHICGTSINQSVCVKDKNGNALTTERNQAAKWVQHFQEVLNRPELDGPANPPPADDVLELNISPPTEVEVGTATSKP